MKNLRFICIPLLLLLSFTPTTAYELLEPLGFESVHPETGQPVGVREGVDHSIDPLKGNYWGIPFEDICIYGHDAESYRAQLQTRIDAEFAENMANAPVIVAALDPKDVDPNPPAGSETDKYTLQSCAKSLPKTHGAQLVQITPGTYFGPQARALNLGTPSRSGDISISGVPGHPRPIFDRRGGDSSKFRFNGPNKVEITHLISYNVCASLDVGNAAIRGYAYFDCSGDGVVINDPKESNRAERDQYYWYNEWGQKPAVFQDNETRRIGQGNALHPIYAQCQVDCVVIVDHVTSCGPHGSHPVKFPSRMVVATNNMIAWSCTDTLPEAQAGNVATVLMDFRNASWTLTANNYFRSAVGKINGRWVVAKEITASPRVNVNVQAYPFMPHDPRYNDAQTWIDWKSTEYAIGDMENSPYPSHFYVNNVFHRVSLLETMGEAGEDRHGAIISAASMHPRKAIQQFSQIHTLPRYDHDEWIDTGRYYEYENKCSGYNTSGYQEFTVLKLGAESSVRDSMRPPLYPCSSPDVSEYFDGKTKTGQTVDSNGNHIPLPDIITDRTLQPLPSLDELPPMFTYYLDNPGGRPPVLVKPSKPPTGPIVPVVPPVTPPVVDPEKPAAKVRLGNSMQTSTDADGWQTITIDLYKPKESDLIIRQISE